MNTRTDEWKYYYKDLHGDIGDPRHNGRIMHTMTPSRYDMQLDKIGENFRNQLPMLSGSILELGGGYGGLARKFINTYNPSRYTMVDNEPMLGIAKNFVGDDAEYVDAEDIDLVEGRPYNLVIANFCLSEVPKEYCDYISEKIFPNCMGVFIIDTNVVENRLNELYNLATEKYLHYKGMKIYSGLLK